MCAGEFLIFSNLEFRIILDTSPQEAYGSAIILLGEAFQEADRPELSEAYRGADQQSLDGRFGRLLRGVSGSRSTELKDAI